MSQETRKTYYSDPIRYARLLRTAKIVGITPRQVRRVCDGDSDNPVVINTMVRIAQAEEVFDNLLITEVKKLIP